MFDPNVTQNPKPQIPASAKSTSPKVTAISDPVPSQDQIRERAYQLYKSRGGQDGQDQQDWLSAEQQILKQRR